MIAILLWIQYGDRNTKITQKVKPIPYLPDNLSVVEVGLVLRKRLEEQDIIPLILELANKGYIKLMVAEEADTWSIQWTKLEGVQLKKTTYYPRRWKLIWQKAYEGENEIEKLFLEGLFQDKKVLEDTRCLKEKFYKTLDQIEKRCKKDYYKYIQKSSKRARDVIIGLVGGLFVYTHLVSIPSLEAGFWTTLLMGALTCLLIGCLTYGKKESIYGCIIKGLIGIGIWVTGWINIVWPYLEGNLAASIFYVVNSLGVIVMIALVPKILRRTEEGHKIYEKIQGVRAFLNETRKIDFQELEALGMDYAYNMLPYMDMLEIDEEWWRPFAEITYSYPRWYGGRAIVRLEDMMTFVNEGIKEVSGDLRERPSSD